MNKEHESQAEAMADLQAKNRELLEQINLLQMRIEARDEIIQAYRDSLEMFQKEKQLGTLLHKADIEAITKPKTV